ncbi:hypothetical protein AX16_008561 [Volvariella volvacea WC 439]|nr:hypothetical protein AX16_008561 [Volvariella volvacea WC 439]
MDVPLEVIYEILARLTTPTHPLQYGYDDQTLLALYHLCLCSRAIHDFVFPHLYKSIRIQTKRQLDHLHDLFRSKPHIANLVESLYLHHSSGSPEDFGCLPRLLTLIQPTLRRLSIARGFAYRVDLRSLFEILAGCQLLEEFCSLRVRDTYLWKARQDGSLEWRGDWKRLKRLLVQDTLLEHPPMALIRRHPSIRTVILPVTHWRGLSRGLSDAETVLGRVNDIPLDSYLATWHGWSRATDSALELEDRGKAENDNHLQVLELSANKFQLVDLMENRVLDGRVWDFMEEFVR